MKPAAMHETGLHETGLHETGLHETGLHETGLHETGLHETGVHETGLHETPCTRPCGRRWPPSANCGRPTNDSKPGWPAAPSPSRSSPPVTVCRAVPIPRNASGRC
jgi:hypothetical protein